MTDWGLVVDASSSRVTREDFRRLKEGMGVRGFIQCLQTGGFSASQEDVRAVAAANLYDADAEGLAIGGYLNSQPWRPAEVIHEDAKVVASEHWAGLAMVANDVEIKDHDTGALPSEYAVRRACQLIEAEGKRTCIYTARWYWRETYGNPQWSWLLDYKLWNAFYDQDPDIDFRHAPYGPWGQEHVIGEQYAGTTNLGGDLFDLNFFDLDYLKAAGQEDDMFEETDRELLRAARQSAENVDRETDAMIQAFPTLLLDVGWIKAILFDDLRGDKADDYRRLIGIGQQVKSQPALTRQVVKEELAKLPQGTLDALALNAKIDELKTLIQRTLAGVAGISAAIAAVLAAFGKIPLPPVP